MNKKKKKQVEALLKELNDSDDVYKRNKENHRVQVQAGLVRRHYPQTGKMYDLLLEDIKEEIAINQVKIDTGMQVIHPVFAFEASKIWADLQVNHLKRRNDNLKADVTEIEKNVEEVRQEIEEQNARILARRVQIIEQLDKFGYDTQDLKKKAPDYIG